MDFKFVKNQEIKHSYVLKSCFFIYFLSFIYKVVSKIKFEPFCVQSYETKRKKFIIGVYSSFIIANEAIFVSSTLFRIVDKINSKRIINRQTKLHRENSLPKP